MAVKLIALGDKFYQKYVDREIINHRQLVHPHVVAFKEVFVTPQVSLIERSISIIAVDLSLRSLQYLSNFPHIPYSKFHIGVM